jgi:mono/diheme cytochrome c family protein
LAFRARTGDIVGRQPSPPIWAILALGTLIIGTLVYLFILWRISPTDTGESAEQRLARGRELYLAHCVACHGEKGDGRGPALRALYSRPRDFGEARFRLVTTTNAVPSDDDLARVIRNGIPGSGMLGFDHLNEESIQAISTYVRQLMREGVESRLRQRAADDDQMIDEDELSQEIVRLTTPGKPLAIPDPFPDSTPESIARGAELYRSGKGACIDCHGVRGTGDGRLKFWNADGKPILPRDFTGGVFKSGRQPKQLFARILQGMPGTPMPGHPLLQTQEIVDLVHFILSLAPGR